MTFYCRENYHKEKFATEKDLSFGMIKIEPEDIKIENSLKEIEEKIENVSEEHWNEDIPPDNNTEQVDRLSFNDIKVEIDNNLISEKSSEELDGKSISSILPA